MREKLIEFLASFPELSETEVQELSEAIPVVVYSKGSVFQQEGEVPQACYYLLSGWVREYQEGDGEEKTLDFYSIYHPSISSEHYMQQTPSTSSLCCLSDSVFIHGSPEMDQLNFEKFPILKTIVARMLESQLHETKGHFQTFASASPKERYLNLLKAQPGILQMAPLHQIASYLGMTAESLSRIRKRLSQEV